MDKACFYLSAVMCGASWGEPTLFGGMFACSAMILIVASAVFTRLQPE
jgi:hypothetical protein